MLAGKSYKRKDDPHSPRYTVQEQQGDFVLFETGERCKITTLMDQFSEDYIDPQAFWKPKTSAIATAIISGPLETPAMGDAPGAPPVRRIEDGKEVRPIAQSVEAVPLHRGPAINKADPYSFPDEEEDSDPYSFPVDPVAEAVAPRAAGIPAPAPHVEAPAEMPEVTFFRRMRLANNGTLDLKHVVKMPEREQAKVLDTMFETSLVDFLADEYMSQLVQNEGEIKEQIRQQVHAYIYGATKKKGRGKVEELKAEEPKKRRPPRKKVEESPDEQ